MGRLDLRCLYKGLADHHQLIEMIAEGTERHEKKHIIGRPLRLFLVVADPEEQRRDKQHVNDIDPQDRRLGEPAPHGLVGVIDEDNEPHTDQETIHPLGCGGAVESNPQKKGDNEGDMQDPNK